MIIDQNPLTLLLVVVLCAVGLFVFPYRKTERFRLTSSKIAALVIAVGTCVYSGKLAFPLVFVWPLSFIWFPEFWGNYTGRFQRQQITQKSPPILVALMGWILLFLFPALTLSWLSIK